MTYFQRQTRDIFDIHSFMQNLRLLFNCLYFFRQQRAEIEDRSALFHKGGKGHEGWLALGIKCPGEHVLQARRMR